MVLAMAGRLPEGTDRGVYFLLLAGWATVATSCLASVAVEVASDEIDKLGENDGANLVQGGSNMTGTICV
jgi:hypothetical protein